MLLAQVKNKMAKPDFLKNNRGIDDGQDLAEDYMGELYDRIIQDEIKMKVGASPDPPAAGRCCSADASRSSLVLVTGFPVAIRACNMPQRACQLLRAAGQLSRQKQPVACGRPLSSKGEMQDETEGMLAAQSSKAAQAGGWMDTIMNLVPGRKQAAAAGPSEDAIQSMHENLRCAIARPCCTRPRLLQVASDCAPDSGPMQASSSVPQSNIQNSSTFSCLSRWSADAGPKPREPCSMQPQRLRPSGRCLTWPGLPCWAPLVSSSSSSTQVPPWDPTSWGRPADGFTARRAWQHQHAEAQPSLSCWPEDMPMHQHSAEHSVAGTSLRPPARAAGSHRPCSGMLPTDTQPAGDAIHLCLAGFVAAIRVSCLLGMGMLRSTFVTSVARFTLLHAPGQMQAKHAKAFRALLVAADENGNHLHVSRADGCCVARPLQLCSCCACLPSCDVLNGLLYLAPQRHSSCPWLLGMAVLH